jgi:hypothetical protein
MYRANIGISQLPQFKKCCASAARIPSLYPYSTNLGVLMSRLDIQFWSADNRLLVENVWRNFADARIGDDTPIYII